MPERRSPRRRRTNPPTETTLLIASILWLIGFASTILGIVQLPNNLGIWALALSGLLLILASVIYGL